MWRMLLAVPTPKPAFSEALYQPGHATAGPSSAQSRAERVTGRGEVIRLLPRLHPVISLGGAWKRASAIPGPPRKNQG